MWLFLENVNNGRLHLAVTVSARAAKVSFVCICLCEINALKLLRCLVLLEGYTLLYSQIVYGYTNCQIRRFCFCFST